MIWSVGNAGAFFMSQEKTEKATPKKLQKEKEEGNVPRSKELPVVASLIFAFVYLLFFSTSLVDAMEEVFIHALSFSIEELDAPPSEFGDEISGAATSLLQTLLVFSLSVLAITMVGHSAVGGFIFVGSKLKPDFSKIDPISGIKKVFSMNQLMELVKSVLKALLVIVPLYLMIEGFFMGFAKAKMTYTPASLFAMTLHEILLWGLIFSSLFIIVVSIDVPFQIYSFIKKNKMSKQEVKEEFKNTEGDPLIKGKRRQIQMAMSRQAANSRVHDADIIITNPTHYSVALEYDMDKKMNAPVVVGKGEDLAALAIRRVAAERNIPILEIPPLARVLYARSEVGDEIPFDLFAPVAAVVTYLYSLDDRLSFQITEQFIESLNIDEEEMGGRKLMNMKKQSKEEL